MARTRVLIGIVVIAGVLAASVSVVAAASDGGDSQGAGIPSGLPPASSLKECAGLAVTIVVQDGQRIDGTTGNDVVAMDPRGTYSPNGGTDVICDGSGQVQSISYPEDANVPDTQAQINETIRELGGDS